MALAPEEAAVRAFYDAHAGDYDRTIGPANAAILHPRIVSEAERMLGSLRGRRVLDVGCGTGGLIERLLASGVRSASGIDFSAPSVSAGRERGLDLSVGNAADLRFGDGAFHAVVSNHCLNNLVPGHQGRALEEQARVLQSGGVIAHALFPAPEPDESSFQVSQFGASFTLFLRPASSWARLAERCGFDEVAFAPVRATQPQIDAALFAAAEEDRANLKGWLSGRDLALLMTARRR
jgi:ubiquinone/menaquinone biosynthesis C-methylase UbiE